MFLVHFSDTQTYAVVGKVIDQKQKTPLASAFVVLKNKTTSKRKSAITDDQGIYRFEGIEKGDYFIEVS